MADTQRRQQQAVAHLQFVRMAPRKLRRVADAIRGKSVREALAHAASLPASLPPSRSRSSCAAPSPTPATTTT